MNALPGPGHNGGPTLEPGAGWRRHCWRKARSELLPHLPLEVVRIRVNRAKALGLPYRTYATIRASSGQDIVAFLFSSNALNLFRPAEAMPPDRARALGRLQECRRLLATQPPLDPDDTLRRMRPLIGSARAAPGLCDTWRAMADWSDTWLRSERVSRRGVVVVGETALEREWAMAGRTAGFLRGAQYFGDAPKASSA